MDDQTLQRIANIAQIVSVLWILFLGSKTISDIMRGIKNAKRYNQITWGISILIVVLCVWLVANISSQIRLTWNHLFTVSLVTTCIGLLSMMFIAKHTPEVDPAKQEEFGVRKVGSKPFLILLCTGFFINSFVGAFTSDYATYSLEHPYNAYIAAAFAFASALVFLFLGFCVSTGRLLYGKAPGWLSTGLLILFAFFICWAASRPAPPIVSFTWLYILETGLITAIIASLLSGAPLRFGICIIFISLLGAFISDFVINHFAKEELYMHIAVIYTTTVILTVVFNFIIVFQKAVKLYRLQ